MDTSDAALNDRVKLLQYPRLKDAPDPERISDVATVRECRQAVLTMLVKWAALTPTPPAAPQSVLAFTEQRYQESIGETGQYIQSHVRMTGLQADVMAVSELMETLGSVIGASADGKIEGRSQREVLSLMREVLPDMPRAVNKHGMGRVYRGVVMSAAVTGVCSICQSVEAADSLQDIDGRGPTCRTCRVEDLDGPPPGAAVGGMVQGALDEMPVEQRAHHVTLDSLIETRIEDLQRVAGADLGPYAQAVDASRSRPAEHATVLLSLLTAVRRDPHRANVQFMDGSPE